MTTAKTSKQSIPTPITADDGVQITGLERGEVLIMISRPLTPRGVALFTKCAIPDTLRAFGLLLLQIRTLKRHSKITELIRECLRTD